MVLLPSAGSKVAQTCPPRRFALGTGRSSLGLRFFGCFQVNAPQTSGKQGLRYTLVSVDA